MNLRRASLPCLAIVASIAPDAARAQEHRRSGRPGLPEPVLTESATDLDAEEGGELEVSANGSDMRNLSGSTGALYASLEVEWRALRWLGVRLEPSLRYPILPWGGGQTTAGIDATLAFSLVRDYRRDIYLQIEPSAELYDGGAHDPPPPGEPRLPFDLTLRAGFRFGLLTVRPGLGVESDLSSIVSPRANAALLLPLGPHLDAGFVALEADADWARPNPYAVAGDLAVDLDVFDVPLRIALAIPFVPSVAAPASIGMYLRVLYRFELEHDDDRGTPRPSASPDVRR